jgi:Flp pilus assembly protein CpaB
VKKQTLMLVVIGVVLFVAGGAIAFASAVSGTKHQPTPATTAAVNTPVLVAKAAIPSGTTGQDIVSQGLVSIQLIPQKKFVATDLTNLQGLTDEVLTSSVAKGHTILSTQLTPSTTGISSPPNTDDVTITLTSASGLAGYLQPGSRVDVYANISKLSGTSQSNIPIPCTELAMSNIQVLDVSSTVPAFNTHPSSTGRSIPGSETVLLALTPAQAREITFMNLNETLSLVQTQKDTLPPVVGQCTGTGQYTAAP